MDRRIKHLVVLTLTLLTGIAVQAKDAAWAFDIGSTATVGSGTFAPFWLTANRHGLVPTEPSSAYLRTAARRGYKNEQGFDWECGADLSVGTFNTSLIGSPFIVQQLYAGIRYNCWQLTVGSREHASQAKNPLLTSGGMTWSGNARPIPQVRFGIYDYVPVSFLFNSWLQVKGFISYGRTTDDRFQRNFVIPSRYALYTQGALFHEKSAFLRVGKQEVSPFSFELGVEMDCQFGGELWEHDTRLHQTETETMLFANPKHAADYLKAFLPLNGGNDATVSDQNNAAGNHFGSIHFVLNYEGTEWGIRAYYEHYFDGRTGMTPWNATYDMSGKYRAWIAYPWFDGLSGLEVKVPSNPFVSTIVLEYNTTRDQCGSIHHGPSSTLPASIHGFACYYYNSSYPSYQHFGMTAGSPLLYNPIYNADNTIINTDTRIRAFHLGVSGSPAATLRYRLLGTFVRSWGSYNDPLPDPQNTFSALAELTWQPAKFGGWEGIAALALDRSPRIGNNYGLQIGINKTF